MGRIEITKMTKAQQALELAARMSQPLVPRLRSAMLLPPFGGTEKQLLTCGVGDPPKRQDVHDSARDGVLHALGRLGSASAGSKHHCTFGKLPMMPFDGGALQKAQLLLLGAVEAAHAQLQPAENGSRQLGSRFT